MLAHPAPSGDTVNDPNVHDPWQLPLPLEPA